MSENTDYETLKAERDAALAQVWRLVGENVVMKQIIDSVTDLDNEPKYHSEGMGCGLEDRGITDRYDAMQHGWECAMERVYGEVIPCAEELDFTATTQALNEIEARAIENALDAQVGKQAVTDALTGKAYLCAADLRQFAANLRAGRKG
ncbi:hypothetical protein [Yersinia mollaretii]|uniref:hypothetical protein n=1 Tax=Yersinia mollaretii TaxID=33060 RepID=UPI0021BDAF75|nr:hypothetical protein [Yersinia mollaretii]